MGFSVEHSMFNLDFFFYILLVFALKMKILFLFYIKVHNYALGMNSSADQ